MPIFRFKLTAHGLPLDGFRWQPSVKRRGITFDGLKRWARRRKMVRK